MAHLAKDPLWATRIEKWESGITSNSPDEEVREFTKTKTYQYEAYETNGHNLWELFQEDFGHFAVETWKVVGRSNAQALRTCLRRGGVYVDNNDKHKTIWQCLEETSKEGSRRELTLKDVKSFSDDLGCKVTSPTVQKLLQQIAGEGAGSASVNSGGSGSTGHEIGNDIGIIKTEADRPPITAVKPYFKDDSQRGDTDVDPTQPSSQETEPEERSSNDNETLRRFTDDPDTITVEPRATVTATAGTTPAITRKRGRPRKQQTNVYSADLTVFLSDDIDKAYPEEPISSQFKASRQQEVVGLIEKGVFKPVDDSDVPRGGRAGGKRMGRTKALKGLWARGAIYGLLRLFTATKGSSGGSVGGFYGKFTGVEVRFVTTHSIVGWDLFFITSKVAPVFVWVYHYITVFLAPSCDNPIRLS